MSMRPHYIQLPIKVRSHRSNGVLLYINGESYKIHPHICKMLADNLIAASDIYLTRQEAKGKKIVKKSEYPTPGVILIEE